MAIPTATEIREYLEGYCIDETVLTDLWIEKRRDRIVIPHIEKLIKRPIEGVTTITEYVSGNGQNILILSHKFITELVSIGYVSGGGGDLITGLSLGGVLLLPEEGMIETKSNIQEGNYNRSFRKGQKNIKVVYKVGSEVIEPDLHEAVILLCSDKILGFVGARTGGGSIQSTGYSRNFGARGKYQDARNDFPREAYALIRKYTSGISGR